MLPVRTEEVGGLPRQPPRKPTREGHASQHFLPHVVSRVPSVHIMHVGLCGLQPRVLLGQWRGGGGGGRW